MSATVFHIPFILDSPCFELYAIVQQDGDSAKRDHPTVKIYKKVDDLFANPTVDLVILSTPPPTHFDLATKALNAGKNGTLPACFPYTSPNFETSPRSQKTTDLPPVVIEKPFAPTTAECDTLIALARLKQLLLSVLPELGRVVEFEPHFDHYDPEVATTWAGKVQAGSGVVYDLGAHLFDQVLQLYGLPAKITEFLGAQRRGGNGVMDACTVLLHYGDGMLVTVKASAVSAYSDEEQLRFWVRGDRGSYRKYYMDPQALQIMKEGMELSHPQFWYRGSESRWSGELTVYKVGKLTKATVPSLHPPLTYRNFYELLAAALGGKGEVPITPESARDVIRLVELATKSSQEGRTLAVE